MTKRKTYDLSWMPLHVADWLGSETVASITPATECAYLRLLMYQWRSEDGGLPDDPERLRAMSRLGGKAWPAAWAVLGPMFPTDPDGRRRNPRLAAERAAVLSVRGKQSLAGQESGKVRARANPPEEGLQSFPGKDWTSRPDGLGASQVVENQHPSMNVRSTSVQQTLKNPNPNKNPTPSTAANAAAVSPQAGTPAAAAEPANGTRQPGVSATLGKLDPAHRGPVAAYLDALAPARQLAVVSELDALASGMHGPGGRAATWWQIGAGFVAALAGGSQRVLTPVALRGFVFREPVEAPTPAAAAPVAPGTVLDDAGAVQWHPGMPPSARPSDDAIAAHGWRVAA